jgi:DNA-binding FadR family transcriptional regulator
MDQTVEIFTPPWVNDLSRHPLISAQAKEIATRIFTRIASGTYAFGTRIPAERDLAAEFQETRGTIRQALEFLAAYDGVPAAAPSSPTGEAARPASRATAASTRDSSPSTSSPRRPRRSR